MAAQRDLLDPTDPANLHPKQRLEELATILAVGVIRMRAERETPLLPVRSCRKSPQEADIQPFSSTALIEDTAGIPAKSP